MGLLNKCFLLLLGLGLAACRAAGENKAQNSLADQTTPLITPITSITEIPSKTILPTASPSSTPTLTPTQLPSATTTPTPSPTPTIQYPVKLYTPLPQDLPQIASDNLNDLARLAQWGDGQLIGLHHFEGNPWLAAVFDDGLRVYNGSNLEEMYWLPGSIPQGGNPVYSYYAFSPDGLIFALLENWSTLKIWELKDGQLLRQQKAWEHLGCVQRPVVSPSHNSIAIIGGCNQNNDESRVTLFRISDGKRIVSAHADQGGFSANGKFFITLLNQGKKVSVWDTESGNLIHEISTADEIRCPIVYSWSSLNWQKPATPGTHNNLECYAVSPDSKILAISTNSVVELWELNTGNLIKNINGSARTWFSENGSVLIAKHWGNSRYLSMYETDHFSQIAYFPNRVSETISPSGRFITSSEFVLLEVGLYESRGLVLQDVTNQRRLATFPVNYQALFSDDEAYLALYISEFSDQAKVVKVIKTLDGSLVVNLPGETNPIFHPDGNTLITTNKSQVSQWNLNEGTLIKAVEGVFPVVLAENNQVAMLGLGKLFTTSSQGQDGLIEAPMPIHPIEVLFTANGKMMIEHSLSGTRLIDLASLQSSEAYPRGAVFSQDGSFFAQALGNEVEIHRTSDNQLVCKLATEQPLGILFNPQENLLAISHAPRDLTIWDYSNCQLVHKLSSDNKVIHQMAFTPDGQSLLAIAKPNARGARRDLFKWDTKSGTFLKSRSYVCNWDLPLKISGDGRYVIYGANDCALRVADTQYLSDIWSLNLGERVNTINAVISYDGNLLITTHEQDVIRFWDIPQQKEIKVIDPNSEENLSRNIYDLNISPNGEYLTIVGEGLIQLWSIFDRAEGDSVLFALETPTPLPPRDPIPEVFIFDDFSDTNLRSYLWQSPETKIAKLFAYGIKNGIFEVRKKNLEEGGFIQFRTYYYMPEDPIRAFELRFQVPVMGDGKGAFLWLDIAGGLPNDQWWENRCVISGLTTPEPQATCAVGGIEAQTDQHFSEYEFNLFPQGETFHYGQWYTLRYEIDKETGTLYYYLDDQLVQIYQPKDAQVLKRTELSMNIAMWVDTLTSFYAWFDDVRITR